MKILISTLRILGLLILAIILANATIETGDQSLFEVYPIFWLVLGVILVIGIAIEASISALDRTLYLALKPEAKAQYDIAEAAKKQNNFAWLKETYNKLLDKKPLENEEEIILDHNYDGIQELDNNLPPWWLYGFYISMIFAVVYMTRYYIFDGASQKEEYLMEVAEAKAAVEEYKKNAKDLIDAESVELLTDAEDINAGKAIFAENCVACHKADAGGGIGPNLTDKFWLLGGGIKNVFHTISEGGRAGKGMVSWKTELKPAQIAQVASYVISLQGTTPAEPKEPQGDLWVDENAENSEASLDMADNTSISENTVSESAQK